MTANNSYMIFNLNKLRVEYRDPLRVRPTLNAFFISSVQMPYSTKIMWTAEGGAALKYLFSALKEKILEQEP